VDSDRYAGILMCTGAIVGLAGSIAVFYAPPFLLGPISFALVLPFAAYGFRKRKESRLLAGAVLWFALLGGAASLSLHFVRGGYMAVPSDYYWKAAIAAFGTALAVAGAAIKLRREPPDQRLQ
jgi:hypothetical protein